MTNARWQRWLVALHGLCIAAWVLGFWPRSPALALAGLVVVPLLSRLAMLPQFLLMAWVCRHGDPPRPSPMRLLRAWWAESRWAALVFGWWQPFRARAVPDWLPPRPPDRPAPRGVVLVHGFLCNRAFWTPWFAPLRARGHAFAAVTLEPAFGSIDDYCDTIDAAVRRVTEATGRAPLIVGHSMGGLAIRAWLRARPDAETRVQRVVTVGAPHDGTWPARHARSVAGQQMRLHGSWVRQLRAQEPAGRAALFRCWYSNGDNVVYPPAAAMLHGADNRFLDGLAHVEMAFDPRVVRDCLGLLEGA
ncbi:esterase/lipase family protein [Alicycliphilus denitrificans]|uniref:esterase/lipase family protein n=1 Tax=Alicycliphilus denitrificans TaxID=179636 RepID=UPI00384D9B27